MDALNKIESLKLEYLALPDNEWRKDYFNQDNGGYLVTSRKRIHEALTKREPEKLTIEHNMCLTFARSGFRIRHYEDEKSEGSFDVTINGIRADLKRTKSTNNIIRYAKHAFRVQNAEIILVEFEQWGNDFRNIVSEMTRKGIHGYYFVKGSEVIHSF